MSINVLLLCNKIHAFCIVGVP